MTTTDPTTPVENGAKAIAEKRRTGPTTSTRALSNLSHGGHVLADPVFNRTIDAVERNDLSKAADVRDAPVTDDDTTPFGYLLVDLADAYPAAHLPDDAPSGVLASLKALGSAMIEEGAPDPAANSTVPPIYTYWGQFIDHDLTANTDRDDDLSITEREFNPLEPEAVLHQLRNLRQPALNLDSLYGDGPGSAAKDAVPYSGFEFVLGRLATEDPDGNPFPGTPIPGIAVDPDPERDLPRRQGGVTALIGDGRNDENLIVAQLHVAFLRFHNEVFRLLVREGADANNRQTFDDARRLVTWTYQWLVANDFLTRLIPQSVIDAVRANPRYSPTAEGAYMPLEFSVAGFRFGHSMVRGAYDHNRNFGKEGGVLPTTRFALLFQFTGKSAAPFNDEQKRIHSLPDNWPIEWDRFVGGPTPEDPARSARKIDTRLTLPLDQLSNEGNDPNSAQRVQAILKRLAVRNLMRGYKLAIPTGQAVAIAFGMTPLTPAQLQTGNSRVVNHALADGGFLQATPLWYYVLKEAELCDDGVPIANGDLSTGGNKLGPVGGRIVAETILGQLRADQDSFMAHDPRWDPDGPNGIRAAGGPSIRNIKDLLTFAGVL